jgi:hypothetical protein
MSIIIVKLQDKRAVFWIFIVLLRFLFESPFYIHTRTFQDPPLSVLPPQRYALIFTYQLPRQSQPRSISYKLKSYHFDVQNLLKEILKLLLELTFSIGHNLLKPLRFESLFSFHLQANMERKITYYDGLFNTVDIVAHYSYFVESLSIPIVLGLWMNLLCWVR